MTTTEITQVLRALLYERISNDKKAMGLGVLRQREANERAARNAGATELIYYRDNDLSASKEEVIRPNFERLLADIRSGDYDGSILVCWAQDRIARQGLEFEQLWALLEKHQIRFIAEADGIDVKPWEDGALIPRIRQAVAAEEIRKLKYRLKGKQAQNRTMGKRHGKIPFGWNADGTPAAVEADMVRDATARILAGSGTLAIARDWNAQGITTRGFTRTHLNGVQLLPEEQFEVVSQWTARAVKDMVLRASNAGRYEHKGVAVDVEVDWEPLVSEESWLAVRAIFASKSRPHARRRHLLGGLLMCGREGCGGSAPGVVNRSKGAVYELYRCGKCQQMAQMALVDDYVLTLVRDRLAELELPDLASGERRVALNATVDRIDTLRARLADADARYGDLDHPNPIDADQHARLTGMVRPALAKAQADMERLTDGRMALLAGLTGKDAVRNWPTISVDRRRATIKLLVTLTLIPAIKPRSPATLIEDRIGVSWNQLA